MIKKQTASAAAPARTIGGAGTAIDIWVLAFPGFLLLDASGPIQVFSSANDEARDAGLPPPYRIHLITPGGGAVASSAGISMLAGALPRRSLAGATLIVAGGQGLYPMPDVVPDAVGAAAGSKAGAPTGTTAGTATDAAADTTATPGDAVLRWIARASLGLARCCAVCTGAFVLARAGLLNQRRAVTHWQDVAQLRAQHPAVLVQDDAIHVRDGKFYTSAGISAGMDLALSLVEEDLGHAAALAVAKRLVLFLKRPGGQRQFSAELLAQTQPQGVSAQLTAWLRPRLRQQIDIEQMAAACALSVRTLHRKLRQEADLTPVQLLARLRMELACGLLERRGMTVKQAARQSGYGTEYNLRRAFAAQLGVLPSEYQSRFGCKRM
ncbi:GlxA family transcriptional regulator [Rugamonas apoptosis]|uniref:Helix-turn-helix domain-containing protein n=1 Tax=Rugamonas apoptosis TaxID=2758570 RepID=A0A7W2FEF2_9BURK|nr:AraC family transcriptional regulator [Rugamonas apoptosis]MBA5690232.1 helix-turn-helix domain-containing protein [Rugamonas apoptosis]